jgi:hypothetical protein
MTVDNYSHTDVIDTQERTHESLHKICCTRDDSRPRTFVEWSFEFLFLQCEETEEAEMASLPINDIINNNKVSGVVSGKCVD